MRRITSLLFVSIFYLSIFSSCQKEINPENTIQQPPVETLTDSNYLSKIYQVEDDGSGGIDTFGITSYTFDDQKRVLQLIDSSDDNSFQLLLPFMTTQYFYQGNDSLPYKCVETTFPDALPDFDTLVHFFTYNTAGLVIADSLSFVKHEPGGDYLGKNIGAYQYNGNTIIGAIHVSTIDAGGNMNDYIETDTAQTDANGNILSNVQHDQFREVHSDITWDNNPSPFARLSNFRTIAVFPHGETFYNELPEKNNRLHITENTIGGLQFDEDFTGKYSYNANGYPNQIIYPEPASPGSVYKILFRYKSL